MKKQKIEKLLHEGKIILPKNQTKYVIGGDNGGGPILTLGTTTVDGDG